MSLGDAVEIIGRGSRFLVACHRRPDADALGSAMGLAAVLRSLGKEAVVYVPEVLPETVRFLDDAGTLTRELDPKDRFDATFLTDTASAQLLPNRFPDSDVSGPVVVLDHHAAHDAFGDVVVRDLEAAATGEVVVQLAEALGVAELPAEAAEPLYAALVADTGGSGTRAPAPRPFGSGPGCSTPARTRGSRRTTSSRTGRGSGSCFCASSSGRSSSTSTVGSPPCASPARCSPAPAPTTTWWRAWSTTGA